MTARWDPTSVKAQLRLTSQRLGQLQEKKDSQGVITRKDIATLLQQGNVTLARVKAQNLIQDDATGDLLEVLEMYVGVILEHFSELEQSTPPGPVLVEAATSIIYAAPQTESKELQGVRDMLIQRLGADFTHSAIANRDGYVSPRVVRTLSAPPPSAAKLDIYMSDIAQQYGVTWVPAPQRQDVINSLSEILDLEMAPTVDIVQLRKYCIQGIPDEPSWLRPRIWKLFLGILPVLKSSWTVEIKKQRDAYYDLVRRLLPPFANLPPPAIPPLPLDASLLKVQSQLQRIPPVLFNELENDMDLASPGPLIETCPDEIKIQCSQELERRLRLLRSNLTSPEGTPEICLESGDVPGISVSSPSSDTPGYKMKTLLPSKPYGVGNIHPHHYSALLRLLYLHSSINPGNLSPHIPSLLIPIYTVAIQEVEQDDLIHAEADAFWMFEAVVGEFSELEDEEGGSVWMKRFSERLQWADQELWDNLCAKGLDPALPHYSYRWLSALLTHTVPLPSALLIWDLLFSRKVRDRDGNPKLDFLLDVCTGMLLRAKGPLLRLGKGAQKSPGLWAEDEGVPPPSPLRPWELGDAFMEGTALLRLYPLEAAGGIEHILQTANDLSQRRGEELRNAQTKIMTLGERLKNTMWKGFTNQVSSAENSPEVSDEEEDEEEDEESEDDGNETETPVSTTAASSGPTSVFANMVWRGITNQSSMDPPPTPLDSLTPDIRPSSPSISATTLPFSSSDTPSNTASSLWRYAEKLKDSDAAATFAKVSSNWRAKAMLGSWGVGQDSPQTHSSLISQPTHRGVRSESLNVTPKSVDGRRGSFPGYPSTDNYSPPPRPAFFRPPRDSWHLAEKPFEPPTSPPASEQGHPSPPSETKGGLQASWAALTRSASAEVIQPIPKSAPRPLLLGSSKLTGRSLGPVPRSSNNTPHSDVEGQWAEVMKAKRQAFQRESISSISSLSPSDAFGRRQSDKPDWDSDIGGSRKVPLNRRSVSPMAPRFRRPESISSGGRGSPGPTMSPPVHEKRPGWGEVILDSSPANSPPGPRTPHMSLQTNGAIRISGSEQNRGSVVLNELQSAPLEAPSPSRKVSRKKTPPPQSSEDDTSDSALEVPSRLSRARSKKYPPRPASLQIQQDNSRPRMVIEKSSPGSLTVDGPHEEQDAATTPKATSFDGDEMPLSGSSPRRTRKASAEDKERPRKNSAEQRARKVSTSRRVRDSSAEEGDDEGYDELLSAYESEEGTTKTFLP